MIKQGAIRTATIPKVRVSVGEREQIDKRAKKLGFDTVAAYVRYCINKEMGG